MITLSDLGSFHVGGRRLAVEGRPRRRVTYSSGFADVEHDPNGDYWVDQAYVQYFIPAERRFRTPVLLVHGGGLTGACWETTPDGRPGWLPFFLGAGLATYVIDNVERGRAGFCALEGVWPGVPIVRSEEEAWSLYRFGDPESYASRTPHPGAQFPVEAMDALAMSTVPRWPGNGPLLLAGLLAAIRRIGPCAVVGHSQGGGLAVKAAVTLPDLIRACVAIEPHGAPASIPPEAARGRGCLFVMGDYVDASPAWRNLDHKARQSRDAWIGAGGLSEVLELPARGIAGNSHMPMMDRNSDTVALVVLEWLDGEHARGALP